MKFREMTVVSKAIAEHDVAAVQRQCQQALQRDPGDWFALVMLARTFADAGQYDRAGPMARRMLLIRPDDFDALQIALCAAEARGDYAETLRHAQRLAQVDVGSIEQSHRKLAGLLRWLAWIPLLRRLRRELTETQTPQDTWRRQWVHWARDYVAAARKRAAAND